MKPFKVRDFRNKSFFLVDDVYLNGFAKILGPHAACVYFSLCRHADKTQYAFPSEKLIAEEFNMSERTVRSKISLLKKRNIIEVVRERSQDGKWLRNTYILLDKSEWRKPEATPASGPEATDDINQRQPLPLKDTHIIKDTHNITPISVVSFPLKKENKISDITPEILQEISDKYKVPLGFVQLELEKLINYCEATGRVYTNYTAALRNFVLKDMQRQIERPRKGGVIDATSI